jgi:hypothetical protein
MAYRQYRKPDRNLVEKVRDYFKGDRKRWYKGAFFSGIGTTGALKTKTQDHCCCLMGGALLMGAREGYFPEEEFGDLHQFKEEFRKLMASCMVDVAMKDMAADVSMTVRANKQYRKERIAEFDNDDFYNFNDGGTYERVIEALDCAVEATKPGEPEYGLQEYY